MTILDKFLRKISDEKDVRNEDTYDAALTRKDYAAAVPLLREAIAKDDARAMGAFAAMCATGNGIAKDPEEACIWFRQAATRGDAASQWALGMCLSGGVGTPANLSEGVYWLFRASKAGNRRAFEILEPMVEKNKSLIGPHFSEAELLALSWQFKKSESRLPASKLIHSGATLCKQLSLKQSS